MKRVLSLFVCALLMIGIAATAHPYSFNAYNGMTGNGVLALSPTLFVPISPEFGTAVDLIGSYGFTAYFDLFVNAVDFNALPQFGYAYSWIMPRWEFLPGHIAAVQFQFNNTDPVSFNIVPQYHLFLENDVIAFELNASVNVPINDPESAVSVGGIIAPVWKAVQNIFYLFIEIDPSYAFENNGGLHLNVVPGIWLGIPETPHQLCLAFSMNDVLSGEMEYWVNFWYSVSFNLVSNDEKK